MSQSGIASNVGRLTYRDNLTQAQVEELLRQIQRDEELYDAAGESLWPKPDDDHRAGLDHRGNP